MKNKKIRSTVKKEIQIQCVIFDWDGTLLDSFEADAQAYFRMFDALGMKWSREEFLRHYSPNWHRVYRAARLPRARWDEADRLWRRFYRSYKPELQSGASRVLRTLEKRFTLALVSSGSRGRVRRQLREHQVDTMFRTKVCSEDAPRRKPHPAPLRMALDRLRIAPKLCVYVGDAPEDIEMAHRAGVRAIGVLGGSPVPGRLQASSPDAMIETIRELPALLKKFK
ncbi:MAG: HAD family hydrolase [Candidatus Acidiferrales bacterium]|jgi:HAD superfamily hydrolase (TIGR01549 family)